MEASRRETGVCPAEGRGSPRGGSDRAGDRDAALSTQPAPVPARAGFLQRTAGKAIQMYRSEFKSMQIQFLGEAISV